ncbi:MAG: hypothetical protein WAK26_13465 [Terracidiphilus sp.]
MNEAPTAVIDQPSPVPPTRNAAVVRCCTARESSLRESRAKALNRFETKDNANAAYCDAMPDLSGHQNIRDFIACVAHGMVTGVIHAIEGPKFLYAAQVAIGALRREPKEQKQPAA